MVGVKITFGDVARGLYDDYAPERATVKKVIKVLAGLFVLGLGASAVYRYREAIAEFGKKAVKVIKATGNDIFGIKEVSPSKYLGSVKTK